MMGDAGKMSCEEFQAQLPELIGSGVDVSAHPHLESLRSVPRLTG